MITENRKKATDVRPETVQKPPEPVADRTDGQARQNEKTPFPPFRRELDEYLFRQGTAHRAWEYLGAHEEEGQVVFRVWAPHAVQVALVGSFCDWENGIPMQRAGESGLYVLALPQERVPDGALYKYRILGRDGNFHMKADPYGRSMEAPPGTATVFARRKAYPWNDRGWLAQRRRHAASGRRYPINIYEIHLGSWMRRPDGSHLGYRELADQLAPYLKQMGYTHVELMPVMEHPFDGSWGYQICGYYAPTARYGSPDDFRAFVDILHGAGIGVLLDWVPAHFPKDAHGLYRFDGEPTYEYAEPTRQENRGWGTCCFDVGRPEVVSFLLSNAYYWVEEFHVDGLRVDAVASMLSLDYDRAPGEWKPNRFGDHGNLEAIAFFQHLNRDLHADHPDVLTVAEESTAWPHITDFYENGLGFSYKWNMGWMNDTLRYAGTDPLFRKHLHGMLAHTFDYAFTEQYILPISHDEVVHGKKSFLDRMPGEYAQKFAGARVFAAFMMTHPGAKLWFMGCEIGQFAEWDEKKSVEWFLLDYPAHAALQHYFAALQNFYLEHPALWDEDPADPSASFAWLDVSNAAESIFVFRRISREGKELVAVLNFTPVPRPGHTVPVPYAGQWREVFNSDETAYGGSGMTNPEPLTAPRDPAGEALSSALTMDIPPMGCVLLAPVRVSRKLPDKARPPRRRAACPDTLTVGGIPATKRKGG